MKKKFSISKNWEIITVDSNQRAARHQATQNLIDQLTEVEIKFLIDNEFVLIYRLTTP